jgi:hypothetical protein
MHRGNEYQTLTGQYLKYADIKNRGIEKIGICNKNELSLLIF